MRKLEINLRERLSEWRFWMVVAYVGLGTVLLSLVVVNARTSRATERVAGDEAIHQAEIENNRKLAIQQCLDSIPQLKKINEFALAEKAIADVLLANSIAVVKATPTDDPSYQIRLHNLQRLRPTVPAIEAIQFPVPTEKQCRSRGATKRTTTTRRD